VFLACADTSIHAYKLEELLMDFTRTVLTLHRDHIEKTLNIETLFQTDDPYPKRPLGSVVTMLGNGTLKFEHDPEKLAERLKEFATLRRMTLEASHYLKCINCTAELEYTLANPGQDCAPGILNCPECGIQLATAIGKANQVRKIGSLEWKAVPL
jgi:hypothetical protein